MFLDKMFLLVCIFVDGFYIYYYNVELLSYIMLSFIFELSFVVYGSLVLKIIMYFLLGIIVFFMIICFKCLSESIFDF